MSFIGTKPRLNTAVLPSYSAENEGEERCILISKMLRGKFPLRYLKEKVTIFNAQKCTSYSQKKKIKKSTPYAPFICPEHTTSSKLQCHRLPRKADLTSHTRVHLENQAEIPSPQNSPASATLRNSKPVMYLKAFNLSLLWLESFS